MHCQLKSCLECLLKLALRSKPHRKAMNDHFSYTTSFTVAPVINLCQLETICLRSRIKWRLMIPKTFTVIRSLKPFFVVCCKIETKCSLLQIIYVCFLHSKNYVCASWLHLFYHSLGSMCSVRTEVSVLWKAENQLI